jgi:hypothetical protein
MIIQSRSSSVAAKTHNHKPVQIKRRMVKPSHKTLTLIPTQVPERIPELYGDGLASAS